jgi:transposase-like protein
MSPRKLTEDDKQEILEEYRNSEATTSTLAKSFEVSSSTISRFLKNKLSTVEYEDLIQQKRLARTPRGEKLVEESKSSQPAKTKTKTKAKTQSKVKSKKAQKAIASDDVLPELAIAPNLFSDQLDRPPAEAKIRRRRRSTSSSSEVAALPDVMLEIPEVAVEEPEQVAPLAETPPVKLILDKVRGKSNVETVPKSERLILKRDRLELEEDDEDENDAMELVALREMLGEDLEDINDEDEDDEDEDEDEDEDDDISYPSPATNLSNIQILPLSQASLPRTCYLVIDRSAELIVKPLAEFADLGAIPDAETRQTTLPVFDNHRIAKRFSHRRERVIKVPDGRMLQKTSHHLQDKGITRLLIDGRIYSLSH